MTQDPYGLLASGLPPEIAAEAMGIKGRQAIAKALFEQSMQPLQAPEVKGRFSVPISPFQGLSKLASAYVGSRGIANADKGYSDLGTKYQKGVADAMTQYEQTKRGVPGQMVPQVGEMGESYPAQEQGGVKGDPRKAVMDALTNGYLSKNPLVLSDIKAMGLKQSGKPSNTQEYEYLKGLSPAEQEKYLRTKRADK